MTSIEEKAKEFGAKRFSAGIAWFWAYGFPSKEKAQEFVDYLCTIGADHRGVYPPSGNEGYAVRYR